MQICYLCGNFLKKGSAENDLTKCPKCNVYYCENCSSLVYTCYICGGKPEKTMQQVDSTSQIEDIFAEMLANSSGIEKRKNPRRMVNSIIEYFFSSETSHATQTSPFKGLTLNISDSGLCLNTMAQLKKGQEIRIVKTSLPLKCNSAIVQWVKKVDTNIYSAGLKFTCGIRD